MAMTFLGSELNPMSKNNKAILNIVLWCSMVWLFLAILGKTAIGGLIFSKLAFTPALPNFLYQPWSIFTYIFMHYDFWHLFSNMLWLFFIGVILEDLTGKIYIWKLFIGGGIFGALFYSIIYYLFLNTLDGIPQMVGASAGVSAIIIGTAVFTPHYRLMLFGILPVELFWIAFLRVLFDIFGAVGTMNQGGFLSHIGGEIFGLLFVLHTRGTLHIPMVDEIAYLFKKRTANSYSKSKPSRTTSVNINRDFLDTKFKPDQKEIDRILDKINQSGYESLTKGEKETLFKAGDK